MKIILIKQLMRIEGVLVRNINTLMLSIVLLGFVDISQVHAITIKIATISPDGTSWMREMRAGASEIKKQTQGRVIFKYYPGGVMGNDDSVLRKIRIGQLQGGAVTAGSLDHIYPSIDIYGLPYLFTSLSEVDYVRSKMDPILMSNLEEKGLVSFGLAEGGFSYLMSDAPLRTVDDVKNQKLWLPSSHKVGEAVFSSAGIHPVTLPLSDVLTGLQTGLIDTVITSPIGAIALQWHTRIKYVVDMPLTYFAALLVIDQKAFNKIKLEDRKIVRQIMSDVFDRIDTQNRKDSIAAREALKNQGVEFISLSQETIDSWKSIGKQALLKLDSDNVYDRSVYQSIHQFASEARNQ